MAAGAEGLENAVSWLHVSELADPTTWLEGGEFLLTTGLGLGEAATSQRAYVRRLAEARHRRPRLRDRLRLRRGSRPGRAGSEPARLPGAGRPLRRALHRDHEVRLHPPGQRAARARRGAGGARAARRRGPPTGAAFRRCSAIVCSHLDCSLALVDESGRVLGERHARRRASFDGALELPVVATASRATLRAAREREALRASTTCSSSTTARRRSRSSCPGGARSVPPSCAWPVTCSRTSSATARRARDRPAHRRVRPRAGAGLRRAPAPLRATGSAASRCAAEIAGSSTGGASATSRRHGATARLPRRGGRGGRRPGARRAVVERSRRRASASAGRRRAARSAAACSRRAPRSTPARRRCLDLPRPRLAGAPARPAGRGARGLRRPRARPGRGQRRLTESLRGAARLRLPLERRGRGARRAPAHPPLPHGAAAGADGPAPGRPGERMELWLAVKATQALAARNGRSTAA